MSRTAVLPMSGAERAKYGAIVSFEGERGVRLTLHRSGPVRKAVALACADAHELSKSFRVVAVSTPQTVYGDLMGRLPTGKTEDALRAYEFPETKLGIDPFLHRRLQGQSPQADRRERANSKPRRARP